MTALWLETVYWVYWINTSHSRPNQAACSPKFPNNDGEINWKRVSGTHTFRIIRTCLVLNHVTGRRASLPMPAGPPKYESKGQSSPHLVEYGNKKGPTYLKHWSLRLNWFKLICRTICARAYVLTCMEPLRMSAGQSTAVATAVVSRRVLSQHETQKISPNEGGPFVEHTMAFGLLMQTQRLGCRSTSSTGSYLLSGGILRTVRLHETRKRGLLWLL